MLAINGGTVQVFSGSYVIAPPPMTLNLGSPALDANGFHGLLQGPPGNYLIEASTDLTSPTNWQAILYYSPTNALYLNFTDPGATNLAQRFYRAISQ